MKKAFSEEEMKAWRAAQPQKMVATKVIVKSNLGNILTVQPTYKKTWQLPGGGVDNGESPEAAGVREIAEETGMVIPESDLIPMGTIYKADEELLIVMYEYAHAIDETTEITVQEDEISGYNFTSADETARHLADYYLPFWGIHYGKKS